MESLQLKVRNLIMNSYQRFLIKLIQDRNIWAVLSILMNPHAYKHSQTFWAFGVIMVRLYLKKHQTLPETSFLKPEIKLVQASLMKMPDITTNPQGEDASCGHHPSRGEELIGYVERGLSVPCCHPLARASLTARDRTNGEPGAFFCRRWDEGELKINRLPEGLVSAVPLWDAVRECRPPHIYCAPQEPVFCWWISRSCVPSDEWNVWLNHTKPYVAWCMYDISRRVNVIIFMAGLIMDFHSNTASSFIKYSQCTPKMLGWIQPSAKIRTNPTTGLFWNSGWVKCSIQPSG